MKAAVGQSPSVRVMQGMPQCRVTFWAPQLVIPLASFLQVSLKGVHVSGCQLC